MSATQLTPPCRPSPVSAFARHYAEMVLAMVVGMVALGVPAAGLLELAGSSTTELRADAPDVLLLGMALSMTVPMVAWMRHRGHGWAPSADMAASMLVPTLLVIVLRWTGAVEDVDTLLAIQHVVMLPSMLAVMLLRRSEYTGHAHRHRPVRGDAPT